MSNGLFRRPEWAIDPTRKAIPFAASAATDVRELRLTTSCDPLDPAFGAEQPSIELLRQLEHVKGIDAYDGQNHQPTIWVGTRTDDGSYPVEVRRPDGSTCKWTRFFGDEVKPEELILEAHQALGRDLFVTTNPNLLQAREDRSWRNVLLPSEALPLVHLYLRTRDEFVHVASRIGTATYDRSLFYLVLLRALVPRLWPFMYASHGLPSEPRIVHLAGSIRMRCIRSLEARDEIGRVYYAQKHSANDRNRLRYHFEYLTLSLTGGFDAQARIARFVYDVPKTRPADAGFQKSGFRTRLQKAGADALYAVVQDSAFLAFAMLLWTVRNHIHEEALGEMAYQSPDSGDIGLLTLDGHEAEVIRRAAADLGRPSDYGVFELMRPRIFIEPCRFASAVLTKGFEFIGQIAESIDFRHHPQFAEASVLRPTETPEIFNPEILQRVAKFGGAFVV